MLVTLNDVLSRAQREHYAVGLFNTTDTDMLQGAIEAAEQMRSPIVIGTAQVLLPFGELDLIGPSLRAAAERASVPVVLHYDHGLTADRCKQALELGFSSIMFDGSVLSEQQNIEQTAMLARLAHRYGATIEGEVGHVGSGDDAPDADGYTTPQQAVEFVQKTGVDALAVAIGTAHGPYKHKPQLDIGRLQSIRAAVDTPLVLHGGSGLSDEDFRRCIQNGIAKVNIFTDLCLAGADACRASLEQGLGYLDMRNRKVEAVKQAVMQKMHLFGSQGKA